MSETIISILVWLHVIGVAIWLGGQIITAACVIPALRAVGDRTRWLDALEGFTSASDGLALWRWWSSWSAAGR